jgi:uncharacterized protein (DUF302 family)
MTLIRLLLLAVLIAGPVRAQDPGLVTLPSAHSVRATLDRFAGAVRAAGWVVFTEIDHAAAAAAVGQTLAPRTVLVFGNPAAGTPAMAAQPTLALDLPMRVLVWQDEAGQVRLTRSSGADIAARIFARHGITQPEAAQRNTEGFLAGLAARAVE